MELNDDKLMTEVCHSNQSGIRAWFDPDVDEIIADRGFRSCDIPFNLYFPHSISKGEKQLPAQKANELRSGKIVQSMISTLFLLSEIEKWQA